MAECIAIVEHSYPREEWNGDRRRVYAELLADFDYEVLKGAAIIWVRSEKKPPLVADLVELCKEIT